MSSSHIAILNMLIPPLLSYIFRSVFGNSIVSNKNCFWYTFRYKFVVFSIYFCLFLYVPQISLFTHFLWYVFNLCKPPKTNFDDLLFLFTLCKPIQANFKDSFFIFNMKSSKMLSTPRDLSNSSQIFKNCYKIHNI